MPVSEVWALVMAGGSGTRFWPLSRRRQPKQLLAMPGRVPLLIQAVRRIRKLVPWERILVACASDHAASVRRLLPRLLPANLLVEPVGRNTAPCVALATCIAARHDRGAIVVALPADAFIPKTSEWVRAVRAATSEVRRLDAIALVGVTPTRPDTGYGYVELGDRLTSGVAYAVRRFVEKPDEPRARSQIASGRHLWDIGTFAFRADTVMAELHRLEPEMADVARDIANAHATPAFGGRMRRLFGRCRRISFDKAVVEKARQLVVVPVRLQWSDLGTFASLAEVYKPDANRNVVRGPAIVDDSHGCLVLGRRPIVVMGVRDLCVVDAGDALLICPKRRSQDVGRIVDVLARRRAFRRLT